MNKLKIGELYSCNAWSYIQYSHFCRGLWYFNLVDREDNYQISLIDISDVKKLEDSHILNLLNVLLLYNQLTK